MITALTVKPMTTFRTL